MTKQGIGVNLRLASREKRWYNNPVMNILINQIFENKEAAALPGLL